MSDDLERPAGPGSGRGTGTVVMADVAKLAGVSPMTVSRVLNSPARVRRETRLRVLDAVRELGYRPNSAARVLATGRSGVLGVVGFDTTLYGPASMLFGIEQAARDAEYGVTITSLAALTQRNVAEAVDRLRGQSVDGVIIIAPHVASVEGLGDVSAGLPVVAVGGGDGGVIPVAAVDQYAGAAAATRHLLDLGHRTVRHLAGPSDWVEAGSRRKAWEDTLRAAGREIPPVVVGDWSPRCGYEYGKRLAGDPSVTAVFTANDQMAVGLIRALHEAGRRIPGDVSVVGFDDVPEAAYLSPPLTTVGQDFGQVGRHALQLLLERIGGAPVEEGRRIIVEPELIVRQSTGRPG
ncbi:LacI family DNA-binding transcriptional regulator [Actinoallomurus acanthiterrae]